MTFQGEIKQGWFERPEMYNVEREVDRGSENKVWKVWKRTFINVFLVDLHEDIWEFLILPSNVSSINLI